MPMPEQFSASEWQPRLFWTGAASLGAGNAAVAEESLSQGLIQIGYAYWSDTTLKQFDRQKNAEPGESEEQAQKIEENNLL